MLTDYRYPGSRSFQDTDLDRKLFFGRDAEKEELLHLILAEKLVVLFAKSGMGKTSLLNAGVLQPLREQGFLPCTIRFNDPQFPPLQAVFTGMTDQLSGLKGIEFTPGPETSLWEYFKTAEFWSTEDTLLTPVLILDQFEDFFDFHPSETRRAAITQLADLVKGRMPSTLKESTQYTDTPPEVKIVIALREDYVGQLDELSRAIPEILDNRFRLTALQRQYAHEAIVKPAQVQDEHITTPRFSYAPEAITTMLDFLCTRRYKREMVNQSFFRHWGSRVLRLLSWLLWPFTKKYRARLPQNYEVMMTDEVEPFQLQLLCQDLESKIQERQQTIVQESDLGGEKGMQKVLQSFYDKQIKQIRWRKRRRVRKLCEKGLLSRSNRRLSLEEEDITRRFKVKKPLLNDLVNSRLLRADPRVGSVYYELCHDTLVAPIRKSSQKHKIKTRATLAVCLIALLFGGMFVSMATMKRYTMFRIVQTMITLPEHLIARGYNRLGMFLSWTKRELKGGETQYRKALELYPEFVWAQVNLGRVLYQQGQYDEALIHLHRAIELEPEGSLAHYLIGDVLRAQEKYDEAIIQYRKALVYNPKYFLAYLGLAKSLLAQGKTTDAMAQCQKALELNPNNADAYVEVGNALRAQGKYPEAIAQFQKAIALEPKNASAYWWLGLALGDLGQETEAMTYYHRAIQVDPKNPDAYDWLGNALYSQGKYAEAQIQCQKMVELDPKNAYSYANMGWILNKQEKYTEALVQIQQALKLRPMYAWAYLLSGDALKAQGKLAEAILQYRKAFEINSDWTTPYTQLGNVAYQQGKPEEAQQFYRQAYDIYEKAYMRFRENIGSKMYFAQSSLCVENAAQAFTLADEVVKRQLFTPAERLAMRFIVVASLLYQEKWAEASTELQALFDYYRSLIAYNEKYWDYEALHNVIEMSEKLTDADKALLLKLIDLLQSPKAESDQKLKELEAALPELLQP